MAYSRVLVENRRYARASKAQLQSLDRRLAPSSPNPGCCSAACRPKARARTPPPRPRSSATSRTGQQPSRPPPRRPRPATATAAAQAYLLLSHTGRAAQGLHRRRALARASSTPTTPVDRADPPCRPAGAPGQAAAGTPRLVRLPPEEAHARGPKQKFLAEVQLLRERFKFQAAYDMLAPGPRPPRPTTPTSSTTRP